MFGHAHRAGGSVVGMLTLENIGEFVGMHAALGERGPSRAPTRRLYEVSSQGGGAAIADRRHSRRWLF